MLPVITLLRRSPKPANILILTDSLKDLPAKLLTDEEAVYARKRIAVKGKEIVLINRLGTLLFIAKAEKGKTTPERLEKWRRTGESLLGAIHEHSLSRLTLLDQGNHPEEMLALAEGIVLGNYQFLKYRKDAAEKESPLQTIELVSRVLKKEEVDRLNISCEAVYRCRSLINEPLSALNAESLAAEFETMGHTAGLKVEVLNKQKIEALRMGGLLAVNRGSIDPPTFTIMEYQPEKAVNSKPLVLVGKGIVFDTGGISLKPASGMDIMKSDMAGAAAAAGAIYAMARCGIPLHTIALIPATDNRPDGNATVPGDIITMMDGTTVEVLNTDAEGRLLLSDALAYAKKYDPMLVIDLATLTGAAQAAIGKIGIAAMHNRAGRYMNMLKEAGNQVYERIAEFPFWDEYADLLRSENADLKNVGGPHAGTITAGKFLQHFTDYPWIHLDIAGPAYLDKKDGYRTAGATAVGLRLLVGFALKLAGK